MAVASLIRCAWDLTRIPVLLAVGYLALGAAPSSIIITPITMAVKGQWVLFARDVLPVPWRWQVEWRQDAWSMTTGRLCDGMRQTGVSSFAPATLDDDRAPTPRPGDPPPPELLGDDITVVLRLRGVLGDCADTPGSYRYTATWWVVLPGGVRMRGVSLTEILVVPERGAT